MASHWYLAPRLSANTPDPAISAFEEGLQIFKTKLTADPKKRARTLKAAKLQDVLDEVLNAQSQYASKKTGTKTQKCIVAFSNKVHYYGKVLDVMVQHHPEYASLAWGAMKIVFSSILEHEKIGTIVIDAMCDVGDALSQVDLAETLYPTPKMKQTIALLYSYIIKFLLRALDWYETGTLSRTLQSITRPAALRYDDLIHDIQKAIGRVSDLSLAGSQAEQRDMHDKLREVLDQQTKMRAELYRFEDMQRKIENLTRLIQETNARQIRSEEKLLSYMQQATIMNQNITASQVDIRHTLSDIQLTQALTFISTACPVNPKASYQHALLIRKTRKFSTRTKCSPFWTSPILHTWDTSNSTSLITLKATYHDRLNVGDFCTNMIEQLLQSRVAVLWILKSQGPPHTIFDILKSLIYQTLSLDQAAHTDTTMSFHIRKFQSAHSVQDYTGIFGELLERFDRVYLIIDTAAVSDGSKLECRKMLKSLPEELADHGAKTLMKVMFIDYRPGGLAGQDDSEKVLRIGRTAQRKSKRVPTRPLQGKAGRAR
ncbi:hypothetical protein K505DRAFT_376150 [Melanomma pulvis-pyrius CBS 109.77]|uniref:DUF7708 domain-containing protein n=1 Tax=Melanomma pulvis-pyrius CBS 109.77 TaxID=1314802 RepID=A0A6A6X8F5_9PLEO|nr:hypothetical protein K505DRAFT_376150 [Melanomma pulvis-pyrius CBS 109.77]